jgi:NAD(P)-dependent dehydrogenase (short-subunit alcohol dehydrogenase family)
MAKVALVTGTSTGIGLSTAVILAKAGFEVVATMRDPGKSGPLLERAGKEGVKVHVARLDVEDQESVGECVAGVLQDHGRIDVLVNNAGAGRLGSLEQLTMSDVKQTFEVNFFGVWRVTQAVLPTMRAARSGRVITVSSVGGLIGQPFNDAYCAAKFAVEGLMESLAPVAAQFGVHVSLIEPGPVHTEFVASVRADVAGRGGAPLPEPYPALLAAYTAGSAQRFAANGQSGDDIARVMLEAATAEAPHLRYPTSDFARAISSRKLVDPTGDGILAATRAQIEKK